MEFWGVEVKAGQPVNVDPGVGKYLHLSQVALGEVKKDKGSEKGSENVPVFVKVDDQKIVLASLSFEKCPHTSLDLMFEKEFELSHNWKKGSVYFSGYRADDTEVSGNSYDTDSDEEEELSLIPIENGKREVKDGQPKPSAADANAVKPESSAVKPKVQIVEPKKAKVEDDDSDDEDDESDDDDDESDDV